MASKRNNELLAALGRSNDQLAAALAGLAEGDLERGKRSTIFVPL
jgi:hypothetical protein